MTFSMLVTYKVFAETLPFKAYLRVKKNDKSITYIEGLTC